jgi:hypothetical protein
MNVALSQLHILSRSYARSKLMCNALSLLHDPIGRLSSYESVRRMPVGVVNTKGWSCELHLLYYHRKSSVAESSLLLVRPDVSEHCGLEFPVSTQ